MDARTELMRNEGIYVCPDWCVQGEVEWEEEQHVGGWYTVVGTAVVNSYDTEVTFQVRPRMTWYAGQEDEVEIVCSVAGPLRLTADTADKLASAISDAHGDLTYYSEVESYDGAADDAEGDEEDEAAA